MNDGPKLPHRDDVPMDVVAQMEAAIRAHHPDAEIVFAGDSSKPEIIAHAKMLMAEAAKKGEESLEHGTCIDCGAQMPGYEAMGTDDWKPAKGWRHFTAGESFMGWQCPDCDAKDDGLHVLEGPSGG